MKTNPAEDNVKTRLLHALKEHAETKSEPTRIVIPLLDALSLCALGEEELPGVSGQLLRNGHGILEVTGLWGYKVTIDSKRKEGDFGFE